MADLTQTISNTVNAFGGSPTTKWNEVNWGEAKWGEGTIDMILTIGKFISNSQEVTNAVATSAEFYRSISSSFSVESNQSEQSLKDGSGYNYVFKKPTTDGEDRNLVDWSETDTTTSTWTCATVAGQNWSES